MLELTYTEKKYYLPPEAINGISFAWSKDGGVALFDLSITDFLNDNYPTRDKNGWFFNSTKDRYIAEKCGERIVVNPQFIYKHFTKQI